MKKKSIITIAELEYNIIHQTKNVTCNRLLYIKYPKLLIKSKVRMKTVWRKQTGGSNCLS